jgi:hypothetical protein
MEGTNVWGFLSRPLVVVAIEYSALYGDYTVYVQERLNNIRLLIIPWPQTPPRLRGSSTPTLASSAANRLPEPGPPLIASTTSAP